MSEKPVKDARIKSQATFNREMSDCLRIVDRSAPEYWLDQGTLLGACRDNRFIEWDSDIDLGIFPQEVDKILSRERELKKAGFELVVISYRGKVHQIHLFRRQPSVNFTVYHKDEGCYRTLWLVPSNRMSRMNVRALHRKSPVHKAYQFAVKKIRSLVPKHVISRLFRDKVVACEVPSRFFEERNEMEFMGKTFTIPSHREEYLEFRYGDDWREPRPDWIYWRDDGTIAG